MGSADPQEKIKKRKLAKMSSFLCLCYILRAIMAGRCRQWRYADHIFIQIYFRMHHFVVKLFEIFFASGGKGHWPPNQNPADVPGCHWCSTHLKYVATLHSNLSLMACFVDINVSQSSVATHARRGGIFNIPLTTNLPRNLLVKNFFSIG